MSQDKQPATQAVRILREHGVAFTDHPYPYEERGGTEVSARALGVDEHTVIKTLIMEDGAKRPLVVLMHGDREVSTKNLARHVGVKSIQPCAPAVANRHSGYQVGGTSPFGTRKVMLVYMERTIADLPRIYINGGRRGYLVGVGPCGPDPGAQADANRRGDRESVSCTGTVARRHGPG
jgi:Cys-tRNA(Pro) deacylase